VLQAARGVRRRYLAISASPRSSPSRLRQIAVGQDRARRRKITRDISSLVGKVDIRKPGGPSRRTIPTPTAISGGLKIAPTRAFSNSSRCSKPRSRCCIRFLTANAGKATTHRHREHRRDPPFTGGRAGAFERGRVAELQGQQEQRSLHRPYLASSRFPYCLRVTEEQKIYEKLISGSELSTRAPARPSTLETLARFFGDVAPAQARQFHRVLPRCGSMTARGPEENPTPKGAQRSGIQGRGPAVDEGHGRYFLRGFCLQGAGRRPSTTTLPNLPQTPFILM